MDSEDQEPLPQTSQMNVEDLDDMDEAAQPQNTDKRT